MAASGKSGANPTSQRCPLWDRVAVKQSDHGVVGLPVKVEDHKMGRTRALNSSVSLYLGGRTRRPFMAP